MTWQRVGLVLAFVSACLWAGRELATAWDCYWGRKRRYTAKDVERAYWRKFHQK